MPARACSIVSPNRASVVRLIEFLTSWTSRNKKTALRGGFWYLVEVAGIEPASVDPTLTGNYMLSLYFKLTDWPVDRQTYRSASPITFSS